jgi:hypothetical protein
MSGKHIYKGTSIVVFDERSFVEEAAAGESHLQYEFSNRGKYEKQVEVRGSAHISTRKRDF